MITKWRYFDDDGVPMFYHEGIETTADNVVDALNAIENQFADLQVHIASLDLQLASRDALIERLVEAFHWVRVENGADEAVVAVRSIIAEWQAMKGGVDFSKVPEVILPDELKLYNQEGE